ncbi:hypothetical protein NDU88_001147 [Pleurodeles waltl]|uniref:Uncharacterized protein n=1 Tax=Pleurodeles waltl TaxID=8319 RepID=A0AAV7MIX4_PLEWA|nr:hypothetical protein NDU88_001147 [Pleurodeles waltl]
MTKPDPTGSCDRVYATVAEPDLCGVATGVSPRHESLRAQGKLIAVAPAYKKRAANDHHSELPDLYLELQQPPSLFSFQLH